MLNKIKSDPPDILGLSNYSWNSNLSEHFAKVTRRYNSECIVLQGGTNFPHERDQQAEFLISRPNTDIYALFEGERSSLKVVERFIETNGDRKKFF